MTYPYSADVDIEARARDTVAAEKARLFAQYRRECRAIQLRYNAVTGPAISDDERRYLLGFMAGLHRAAVLTAPSDPTVLPIWFDNEVTRMCPWVK